MEASILLWIQDTLRNPVCDPIMKWITHLGDYGWIWILIAVLLIVNPKTKDKTRKIGWTVVLALLGSLFVNNFILKNLVARTRPYEVVEGLQLIVPKAVDLSFPSGHSGASFAAATVIVKMAPRRYGIAAFVLASLIAFSRLYVGIHYPTDVLVGVLDGIIIGFLAVFITGKSSGK